MNSLRHRDYRVHTLETSMTTTARCSLILALLALSATSVVHAETITFEDVPTPNTDDYNFQWGPVATGYRGFNWSTNYQNTASLTLPSGFQTAIPQGTRALFTPGDFDQGYCFLQMSRSESWNISSLSVAAAWRSGVTVELLGLRNNQTVFNSFTTLGASGVMNHLSVNQSEIDTLLVIGYGGQPSYPVSDNSILIIDNISYTIPAPGALALFALAGGARRRRRR
jgi:uncharacterized protein (TIGR03382 family)